MFNNILRIHNAGRLMWNGSLNDRGTEGQVHSKIQNGDANAYKVLVGIVGVDGISWDRRPDKTFAASVRCLKD